jgi:hypothetical protein
VVLAVRAARLVPTPEPPSDSGLRELVLTELDDLTSAELDSVLGGLDGGLADAPAPAMGVSGFNDLSPEELERVLRDWES